MRLKKDQNFLGSSVTIPYKEKIMQYLDKIDKKALDIGSINTIKKKIKINCLDIIQITTEHYFPLKQTIFPEKIII